MAQSKAGQRAGQAGGATGAAVGNFFAFIGEDLNAGVFDLLLDIRAAGDQNALAGFKSQQVGAEIVVLFIVALDQLDAAGDEIFTEENGHVLRIDNGLICVDEADDAHQVQAAVLTLAVRHGNDDVLIDKAFGQLLELADALVVRQKDVDLAGDVHALGGKRRGRWRRFFRRSRARRRPPSCRGP